MLGSTRDLGRIRVPSAGAIVGVILCIVGCQAGPSAPVGGEELGGAVGGSESAGPPIPTDGPSTGGGTGIAGGFTGSELSCAGGGASASAPVFATQLVHHSTPARAELFSWVTDEEAVALRSEQQLFRPLGQPSFKGAALQALMARTDPVTSQLATVLGGEQFANGRVAWPEPWAIRAAIDGSDPGHNLVRMVLKPEAWLAVLTDGDLRVVDQQNQPIPLADALASPTRIGAIYHVHDLPDGGPDCTQPPERADGYREFVVTNLALVSEWSIGTQLIRDRLAANIGELTEFFNRTRACPNEVSTQFWNQDVVCSWNTDPIAGMSEELAYQQALANPNDDYSADPHQLAALIDKLQGNLFEPDPLVVTPGSP
jgi:hypothetical protein